MKPLQSKVGNVQHGSRFLYRAYVYTRSATKYTKTHSFFVLHLCITFGNKTIVHPSETARIQRCRSVGCTRGYRIHVRMVNGNDSHGLRMQRTPLTACVRATCKMQTCNSITPRLGYWPHGAYCTLQKVKLVTGTTAYGKYSLETELIVSVGRVGGSVGRRRGPSRWWRKRRWRIVVATAAAERRRTMRWCIDDGCCVLVA